MIDQKDTVTPEDVKENGTRADLRVVSDRVSESFSTVLRKTREKRGLSLQEVAETLHVSKSTLSALEEQRYDKLPADIYSTGYIRSYAALLQLNPEGLVKDFKQSKELLELNARDRVFREQQAQLETSQTEEPAFEKLIHSLGYRLVELKKNFAKQIIILFGLAFLGLFGLIQFYDEGKLESFKNIDIFKVLSADGSVHVSDIMGVESATPIIVSEELLSTESVDRVKMMFSDTTWVTVRDSQKNLIQQSRQQKGEVLEVSGQAPFYIKLSKASAANLYFNGKLIDYSSEVTDDDQLHEFALNP